MKTLQKCKQSILALTYTVTNTGDNKTLLEYLCYYDCFKITS